MKTRVLMATGIAALLSIACSSSGDPAPLTSSTYWVPAGLSSPDNGEPQLAAPSQSTSAPAGGCVRRSASVGTNKSTSDLHLSNPTAIVIRRIEQRCEWEAFRFQFSKPTERSEWTAALSSTWTTAEAIALLQHESPLVREYVAYEVVRAFPETSNLIRPLFSDHDKVRLAGSDHGETAPLSALLVQDLCALASPRGDEEILWALGHASSVDLSSGLRCVRKRRPKEAADIAESILRQRDDAEATRTVAFDANPGRQTVVEKAAGSASADVRLAAVMALPAFRKGEVLPIAKRLLKDTDPRVQAAAGAVVARLENETQKIGHLLTGEVGAFAIEALIWSPDEASLFTLKDHIVRYAANDNVAAAVGAQATAEVYSRGLDLLASELSKVPDSPVYHAVLQYFAEARHAPAVKHFHRAIKTNDWQAIVLGMRGLSAVQSSDESTARLVEGQLDNSNSYVVVAAVETLLSLRMRRSLTKIRGVRSRIPDASWSAARLDALIAELETSTK